MTLQELILVQLTCSSIEAGRRHRTSCVKLTFKCIKPWRSSVYSHELGEVMELLFEHVDEAGDGFSVAAELAGGGDFDIIPRTILLEHFEIIETTYVYGIDAFDE